MHRRPARLLNDMSELVRDQMAAGVRSWRVLRTAEDDVRSGGIRVRADRVRGLFRGLIVMDADAGEIPMHPALEVAARRRIERLAVGRQRSFDARGRPSEAARRTSSAAERARGGVSRRRLHRRIGHLLRVSLQRIVHRPDFELSLDWTGEARHRSGRRSLRPIPRPLPIERDLGEIPGGAGRLVAGEARGGLKHISARLRLLNVPIVTVGGRAPERLFGARRCCGFRLWLHVVG
jgi:hypothetical protein